MTGPADKTLDGLQFGTVSAVDHPSCRVRVRLDEFEGLQTWWLKVPQKHSKATKSRPLMPEIGEQLAVLLQRDGVNGVVLGGVYSTAEPPPVTDEDTDYMRFSDGTSVTYDRQTHMLQVTCVGGITLQAATRIVLQAGESITLTAPRIDLN